MMIETIAKRIYEIRATMGYSTKEQKAEGIKGEVKFIRMMIKGLKKHHTHSSGGFIFELSPNGKDVIITPEFEFRLKLKRRKNEDK